MAEVKMIKCKLEFASPKALNELKQGQFAEKVKWGYYGAPDTELTISSENWEIECAAKEKKASITEWVVNETTHQMALKSDTDIEGYVAIEFPFAMAMLGQLVNRMDLIRYLESLQKVFEKIAPQKNTGEKNDNNNQS